MKPKPHWNQVRALPHTKQCKTVEISQAFCRPLLEKNRQFYVIILFFKVKRMADIFVIKYISWNGQIKAQYDPWGQCFGLYKVRHIELNQGLGNAMIFSELVELNRFCWQLLKGLDTGSTV